MKKVLLLTLVFLSILSCKDDNSNLKDGLYAKIETSKGTIIAQLNFQKTPITVANFITLSEGKNTFVSEEFKAKPFFDGLSFHRVLSNFMIQTGDPLGNGSGDAGYKFSDEITDLKHDKPGILSMANSGPGTNSSQFFITHVPTPWLDGKHTVFGEVVEGMEFVNAIVQGDNISKITIIRKGEEAKKFNAVKVFADFFAIEAENQKNKAAIEAENKRIYDEKYKVTIDAKVAELEALRKTATKSGTGLAFATTKKGSGKKPSIGQNVFIHYSGFLENGELFDSSVEAVSTAFGKYDPARAAQNGYSPIPFKYGNKQGMIPGFIEGIERLTFGEKAVLFIPSNLAYGVAGAGGVIPPNANIIFEVELVEKQ